MNRARLRRAARWLICAFTLGAATQAWAGVGIVTPRPDELVGGANIACVAEFADTVRPVTRLDFVVDGQTLTSKPFGAPTRRASATFVWDATGVEAGKHTLTVRAVAGNTVVASDTVEVVVNNDANDVVPPQVAIVHPRPGSAVQGVVPVDIQALDNSGVSMVTLFIDRQLKLLQNVPPFQYQWDTTRYPNGNHTLEVWAYDRSQNKGEGRPVVVRVANETGRTDLQSQPEAPASSEPAVSSATPTSAKPQPASTSAAASQGTSAVRPSESRPAAKSPSSPTVRPQTKPTVAPLVSPATATTTQKKPAKKQSQRAGVEVSPARQSQVAAPTPRAMMASLPAGARSAGGLPTALKPISVAPNAAPKEEAPAAPKARPSLEPAVKAKVATASKVAKSVASLPASAAPLPKPDLKPATATPIQPAAAPVLVASAKTGRPTAAAAIAAEPRGAQPADPRVAPHPAKAGTQPANAVGRAIIARAPVAVEPAAGIQREPFHFRNAGGPIGLTVDNTKLALDVPPQIQSGVALVPFRQIIEHTGGVVLWMPTTRTVRGTVQNQAIQLTIGSRHALVGGRDVVMQRAAVLESGRTMVPVRLLEVALDMRAVYDARGRMVYLYRP